MVMNMEWAELFNQTKEPTMKDIEKFINNKLWSEFNNFITKTYNISPNLSYSKCAMDNGYFRGWNIKYKKSGKSLGTYYPKEGFFLALIAIGQKDMSDTDRIMPSFTKYIQELYKNADTCMGSKWLCIEVTNEKVLEDLKWLIEIKIPHNNKQIKNK